MLWSGSKDHLAVDATVDARLKLADDLWKVDTSYYLTGEKDIWDYYNGGVRAVFRFQ